MATWLTDDNGNRCSVEYFGSREAAQAALDSLRNCSHCTNCSGCTDCTNCSRCSGCTGCTNCSGCTGCSYCTGCSHCTNCSGCTDCSGCADCLNVRALKSPLVVGPIRGDGYQFCVGSSGSVHAGCRVFTSMDEDREHWRTTRGGTPLGDETMIILDFLEEMAELRK